MNKRILSQHQATRIVAEALQLIPWPEQRVRAAKALIRELFAHRLDFSQPSFEAIASPYYRITAIQGDKAGGHFEVGPRGTSFGTIRVGARSGSMVEVTTGPK